MNANHISRVTIAMLKVIMKTIPLLMAVAALLTGCGGGPGPSVNLVSVSFKDATALETTAVFTLRLSNEQPEPVEMNGSVHKIFLNGLYVGKGLSDATVTVPRLSTVTNDVTVHLSNLALATRLKAVIEAKRFDYRVQSTFFGKSWTDRRTSETEGKLELNDFVPASETTNAPTSEIR